MERFVALVGWSYRSYQLATPFPPVFLQRVRNAQKRKGITKRLYRKYRKMQKQECSGSWNQRIWAKVEMQELRGLYGTKGYECKVKVEVGGRLLMGRAAAYRHTNPFCRPLV